MAYSGYADQKPMYYPTESFETHRLLGLLGRIDIDNIESILEKELELIDNGK